MKTIKIRDDTHKELKDLGFKGESFDDVINKIIKSYKKYELGGIYNDRKNKSKIHVSRSG